MKLGVPNQAAAGETRVATVPDVVRRLSKRGVEVLVESGAGERAHVPDEDFADAGATIAPAEQVWAADAVAVVKAPSAAEIERLDRGAVLIGFLAPLTDADTARALASAGVTSFA